MPQSMYDEPAPSLYTGGRRRPRGVRVASVLSAWSILAIALWGTGQSLDGVLDDLDFDRPGLTAAVFSSWYIALVVVLGLLSTVAEILLPQPPRNLVSTLTWLVWAGLVGTTVVAYFLPLIGSIKSLSG